MAHLDQVGGLHFDIECVCGLQVVIGAEDELRAACSGRNADGVEQDRRLVDVDREHFPRSEQRNPAANVAGQRLHVFQRSHLGFAQTCRARKFLEVEFGVAGDYGEPVNVRAACY